MNGKQFEIPELYGDKEILGVHSDLLTEKQADWIIKKIAENNGELPPELEFLKHPPCESLHEQN